MLKRELYSAVQPTITLDYDQSTDRIDTLIVDKQEWEKLKNVEDALSAARQATYLSRMPKLPPVADAAPTEPFLTGYDMGHLVTYLRLAARWKGDASDRLEAAGLERGPRRAP